LSRLWTGTSGVRFKVQAKFFSSQKMSPTGTGDYFPRGERGGGGVKRLGRQVDYTSPSSGVEKKYEWSCASAHPIRLHVVHRQVSVPQGDGDTTGTVCQN